MKFKKIKLNERMFLKSEISADNVSTDTRTLDLSFASDVPYLRSFGYEIIDMATIDFSRLNNRAILLFNHDWDDYIGVIEKTWVNGNKAYATVRFDTHEDAEKIYQSVLNGVLHQVSFGYEIVKAETVDAIDGIDAYKVSVIPHEISIVTVPADTTVGVGREMEVGVDDEEQEDNEEELPTEDEIKSAELSNENQEVLEKNENVLEIIEKSLDNKAINVNLIMEKTNMDRNETNKQIVAMCREYGVPELALEAVEKEKSVEQVLKEIIDVRQSRASASAVDAGTQKEFNASGYSLGLALKQLLEGDGFSGVVLEMNQELERQFGKRSKESVMLPFHLLQRDVTIGNPASAGALKPTTITTSYIDALYNEMVLVKAGATYLTGLVGDIDIPRFNNIINPEFVAENGEASDSSMDVEMVRLSPKDVTANMLISRKARMQTAYNLEALASDQLVQAIRHKMDIQGLIGAGGLAPTGLLNQTGVQSLPPGTTVSWQDVLDLEAYIKAQNAMVGRGSYITTSKIESKLKGTQKASALGFIADGGNVNGYQLLTTNALPSTAGTNKLIFGDFGQMLIGTWGGLELELDRNYDTAKGLHQLVTWFTYDVAVKRPEAFCFKDGITE